MASLSQIIKILEGLKVDDLDEVFEAIPDRLKKFAQASKARSDADRKARQGEHKTPPKSVEVTQVEVSDTSREAPQEKPKAEPDLYDPQGWEMGPDGKLRRK